MKIITDNFKRVSIWLIFGIFIFTNVGCLNTLGSAITGMDHERVGTFGANPLIEEDSFEKIDLALELDPDGILSIIEYDENGEKTKEEILKENRKAIRNAFKAFKNDVNTKLEDAKTKNEKNYAEIYSKRKRNEVQERILAASEQRCADYTIYLKSLDARSNFILGSLTTAIAGAGAIVTGGASQALSGTAAIFSGVRAEFNQDYFAGLTIQVITDGYHSKRRETYSEISKRQKKNITKYPVEAAIKDALEFHSECSLNAGLEYAALTIKRSDDPGLKQLTKAHKLQGNLTAAIDANNDEGVKKAKVGVFLKEAKEEEAEAAEAAAIARAKAAEEEIEASKAETTAAKAETETLKAQELTLLYKSKIKAMENVPVAEDAKVQADEDLITARTAIPKSDKAIKAAKDAKTIADKKLKDAQDALKKAIEALKIPEAKAAVEKTIEALKVAEAAKTTKDKTLKDAKDAKTKADKALKDAQDALGKVDVTLYEEAVEIAIEVLKVAEAAVEKAEKALQVAEAAKTKADKDLKAAQDAKAEAVKNLMAAKGKK